MTRIERLKKRLEGMEDLAREVELDISEARHFLDGKLDLLDGLQDKMESLRTIIATLEAEDGGG